MEVRGRPLFQYAGRKTQGIGIPERDVDLGIGNATHAVGAARLTIFSL